MVFTIIFHYQLSFFSPNAYPLQTAAVLNLFMRLMILTGIQKHQSRSNHMRCSLEKVVLKKFSKFTGKHQYQSLFLNKVAGLSKKISDTGVFLRILRNFFRTPFLQNTSGRLLLSNKIQIYAKSMNTAVLQVYL